MINQRGKESGRWPIARWFRQHGVVSLAVLAGLGTIPRAPAPPPTRAELINSLRAHFLFFGHDLSGMSDEEIEEGAAAAARLLAGAGVPTADAAAALTTLSQLGLAVEVKR